MPKVGVRKRFKHKKDHDKAKKVRDKKQEKNATEQQTSESAETSDSVSVWLLLVDRPTIFGLLCMQTFKDGCSLCSLFTFKESGSRPPSVASSATESVNLNLEDDSSLDVFSPDSSIVSPSSTINLTSVSDLFISFLFIYENMICNFDLLLSGFFWLATKHQWHPGNSNGRPNY